MNVTLLKSAAIALEAQLHLHAPLDPGAIRLWSALKPLLTLAKAEQISQPLEVREVPGRYVFTERNLQQYGWTCPYKTGHQLPVKLMLLPSA